MMRRALANAAKGWGRTAPNPLVGAVVVSADGSRVADGWHHGFGEAHAEIDALSHAGEWAAGATMYVTLEPCVHHGKTPPCADALVRARVRRVVIATRDLNPIARGGADLLRAKGIQVDIGLEAAAACELNAPFFNAQVSDRPWVTLKMALSADGAIADPTRARRWITGELSRREVHRMRAGSDAIAVGLGTVVADDPELTVRSFEERPKRVSGEHPPPPPTDVPRMPLIRIVFDSYLRVPLTSMVVQTAWRTPTIVVANHPDAPGRAALTERGVEVLQAATLPDALRQLRVRGVRSLLLEGGAKLAGSFLREKLVDRIAIFRAPVTLGPDALKAFAHSPPGTEQWLETLPVVDRRTFGEDTLITYAVHEVPCSPG